ncbi:MAG: flagellar hook-associated protein FlgK [Phycisphaerales bacterium]|nr:MAG: flagellar hook-associated protein FlgK [Phycisphaerales bacterium]
MGLLNSALQIGRSALLGYEGALHVVGNNVTGAGSPDYTRLSPQLDPLHGGLIAGELQPGAGVALTGIQRNIDEALEGRVRLAIGAQASALVREGTLAQVEAFFNDLGGTGIEARLLEFFHTFDELQNTPEDLAIRDLAITSGANLAESLRQLRQQLARLSEDINEQIAMIVVNADEIAQKIARLNEEITTAEAQRQGPAHGLRDQRDALLRELGELFDVTVREQPNGMVNVYVGSEALVQGSSVRGLIAVEEVDGESTRISVRFADTNQQVDVRGGRLEGLIISRDQHGQIDALDQLAAAVIADVNRIHADGQGLVGYTSVTGSYDVLATDVPLDSSAAGVPFPPRNGSFYITVADTATATPVAYRIDVDLQGSDPGTTLESLVAGINAQVEGVTASVTSDNRLQVTADDGFTFTFGHDGQEAREDTSGVLAALGVNTFFTGTDAGNIAVNETIVEQPSLLAAASVFLAGDGVNAGRVAALDSTLSERLGTTSLSGLYKSIANGVAVQSAAVRDEVEADSTVLASLQAQRESISGVNLDEEAIALVKYERAFQGAARFVRTVDDLLAELVTLIR